MQAENMKAAIYCRTATKDDFIIESQRDSLVRFAQSKGYTEYVEYSDNGVSGVTLDRPALNRLNADMQSGKVQAVFISNISRIGRNTFQVLQWLADAGERGIEVYSETGNISYQTDILYTAFQNIANNDIA